MTQCRICNRVNSISSWNSFFSIYKSDPICQQCLESFEVITDVICELCGRPFVNLSSEYRKGDVCYDCIRWEEDNRFCSLLLKNRSVYVYNDFLKEVLSLYKFRGDYVIAEAMQTPFRETFKKYFNLKSLIVPIPLSQERLYERGFNQSLVFAQFLKLPVADILTRTHHEKQSKKSRHERLHSDNFFHLKEVIDLRGKEVVLIDDIYTTGTTLRHAAEILKKSGALYVSSFTLARG